MNTHTFSTSSIRDHFLACTIDDYQIEILCKKLKASCAEVLNAVQEVGYDIDEVREYIRDRADRSLY